MSGRRGARQREAWKTFSVDVTEVRGSNSIRAAVWLASVTGVDGTRYAPTLVWEGEVAQRQPGEHLSPEAAAGYAADALDAAYPGLF